MVVLIPALLGAQTPAPSSSIPAESYRALDRDTQPHGALMPNASPYFLKDGKPTPVGTLTFVRQ